jgi:hypothetical protein
MHLADCEKMGGIKLSGKILVFGKINSTAISSNGPNLQWLTKLHPDFWAKDEPEDTMPQTKVTKASETA